ncbi:hypothetical protein EV421DRAFT_1903646 [Armillaria borealis]|uniref:Protein kinase domain-containing protein n=1 Tax=Armillaria borealis TaxID=47425 RepID=A0AA39JKW0_9AGAR|nr:hypothetical protein EV421DRAFT_1903646 [Armillaria borealis]
MNPAQPHPDDWELDVGNIVTNDENARTPNRGECISSVAPTTGPSHSPFLRSCSFPISSSPSLHPITDYVPGIVIEYIQGVSMGSLQPGVDIPRPVAEAIADGVMDAFCTIKAEESPVLIDFGWALTREPGMNDQEWEGCRKSGCAFCAQGLYE